MTHQRQPVTGLPDGIGFDPNVGTDTASAIDRPMRAQGLELRHFGRYAVRLHAGQPLAVRGIILLAVTLLIGSLNNPPRRGVVTRHRDADRRAVAQPELTLHQPLAEARTTDDHRPVPVLQRPGDDLAGRSRVLVDEHHDRPAEKSAVDRRRIGAGRHRAPLGRDDPAAARQEEVGHSDRLIEQAAAVAPQIEDQRTHALHPLERLDELLHRRPPETVHLDIPRLRIDLVGRVDRMERNIAARHGKRQRRAAQSFGHLGPAQPDGPLPVDPHDPVARQQSHLRRRASGDRVDDHHRVVQHIEFDPDTAETAVEALVDALHLLLRKIGRMGIEPREHPADRLLDQRRRIERIDVGGIHIAIGLHEFLQLRGRRIVELGAHAPRSRAQHADDQRNQTFHNSP